MIYTPWPHPDKCGCVVSDAADLSVVPYTAHTGAAHSATLQHGVAF